MTIPQLRDYQVTASNQLHVELANGTQKVIIGLPTGGGKTTIAASLIFEMIEQKRTVLFLAHRRELIDNAADRLRLYGIRPGIIQGSKRMVIAPVQVASVQTLGRRTPPHADVVFLDECHHSTSPTWKRLIDHYTAIGSHVIGLTATPYRTDGKPLGDLYHKMIYPVTMKDLVSDGFLVAPKFYGPKVDFSKVKIKGSDYDPNELASMFDRREMYGAMVDNYRRFADGKRGFVFNPKVNVSVGAVQAFRDAGYRAAHVDGDTPVLERDNLVNALRRGDVDLLCNVNLFTEGVDIPQAEVAILNRSTVSKSLYLQMVGRVLRPHGTKQQAIVIDQGGNYYHFGGFPMDEIPDLATGADTKKKKKAGASPAKECPSCGLLQHLSAANCEECGHNFRVPKKLKQVEFVDIEEQLAIMQGSGELADLLRKPSDTLTIPELEIIRTHKGYKPGWLVRQLKAQAADLPEMEQTIFEQLLSTYASLKDYNPNWVEHQIQIYA